MGARQSTAKRQKREGHTNKAYETHGLEQIENGQKPKSILRSNRNLKELDVITEEATDSFSVEVNGTAHTQQNQVTQEDLNVMVHRTANGSALVSETAVVLENHNVAGVSSEKGVANLALEEQSGSKSRDSSQPEPETSPEKSSTSSAGSDKDSSATEPNKAIPKLSPKRQIPTVLIKRPSMADIALVAQAKVNRQSSLSDLAAAAENRIAFMSPRRNFLHPFGQKMDIIEMLYGGGEKYTAEAATPGKQVVWLLFMGLLMGASVVVIFLAETSKNNSDEQILRNSTGL